MLAKRFFYTCAGLLCLTLAYQLGANSARAQSASDTQTFGEVLARRFVITDDQGRPRINLETLAGSPIVALNDERGKMRLTLVVGPGEEAGISLNGPDETPTATLTADQRISLLSLKPGPGTGSVSLGATQDGSSLLLRDEAETARAAIVVGKNREHDAVAKMVVRDKSARVVWQAPQ